MSDAAPVPFDNSYARLPERFYARLPPTPVAAPRGIWVNRDLARLLRIDAEWLASPAGVEVIAGNRVPAGAEPIALAYGGHQFGHWNPTLGDGRALLLGEVIGDDGRRYDIQLKGSGPTPYSRNGDGRAPLGPVLRELVVSEAMSALGIPTTRVLAAVSSGEVVYRERPLPGGVLARVAQSHIRVGTLEWVAARRDRDGLRVLVDHVIERHYPDCADAEHPARALLDEAVAAQARLVAQWQLVGFIHGVMNTDNTLLSGETIDYGPCAFMDAYHPDTVYSSIDHGGRYAFANQPRIAHWNLARLAEALSPLLHDDADAALASAREALDAFPALYAAAHAGGVRGKLGLVESRPDDDGLIAALFAAMSAARADFTLTFRRLADLAAAGDDGEGVAALFELPPAMLPWVRRWQTRAALEPASANERRAAMRRVNPIFIPRNHLVEQALADANEGDFAALHRLSRVLADPFTIDRDAVRYAMPPRPEQVVRQTFCGT